MAFSEHGNAFDQAFSRAEVEEKHAALIAQGEDPESFLWVESDRQGMPTATYSPVAGWVEAPASPNR